MIGNLDTQRPTREIVITLNTVLLYVDAFLLQKLGDHDIDKTICIIYTKADVNKSPLLSLLVVASSCPSFDHEARVDTLRNRHQVVLQHRWCVAHPGS